MERAQRDPARMDLTETSPTEMSSREMDPASSKFLPIRSAPAQVRAYGSRPLSTLVGARLQALWHWLIGGAGIRLHRKALAVCETTALGDRRFVCVIRFEHQRFLIGSSPSSVTLLAQLPDEIAGGAENGRIGGERN